MKKKIISLVLSLAVCFTLVPSRVSAISDTSLNRNFYELADIFDSISNAIDTVLEKVRYRLEDSILVFNGILDDLSIAITTKITKTISNIENIIGSIFDMVYDLDKIGHWYTVDVVGQDIAEVSTSIKDILMPFSTR